MMSATWHCTARLVYGVSHGLVLPVWRGDGSRPRRTHSRLGGAAVVTGSREGCTEVVRTVRTAADHAALNEPPSCPRAGPTVALGRRGQHRGMQGNAGCVV